MHTKILFFFLSCFSLGAFGSCDNGVTLILYFQNGNFETKQASTISSSYLTAYNFTEIIMEIWETYLYVPYAGNYTFVLDVPEDATLVLYIDGNMVINFQKYPSRNYGTVFFNSSGLRHLLLNYTKEAVSKDFTINLLWWYSCDFYGKILKDYYWNQSCYNQEPQIINSTIAPSAPTGSSTPFLAEYFLGTDFNLKLYENFISVISFDWNGDFKPPPCLPTSVYFSARFSGNLVATGDEPVNCSITVETQSCFKLELGNVIENQTWSCYKGPVSYSPTLLPGEDYNFTLSWNNTFGSKELNVTINPPSLLRSAIRPATLNPTNLNPVTTNPTSTLNINKDLVLFGNQTFTGNFYLQANVTLSLIDGSLNVTGCVSLGGNLKVILNRTFESGTHNLVAIYSNCFVSNDLFQNVRVLVPGKCTDISNVKQVRSTEGLSVYFDLSSSCGGLKGGAIAGIAVGCLVVLAIIVIVIVFSIPELKMKVFPYTM